MTAAWTAGIVRARLLAERAAGAAAREVASASTWRAALEVAAESAYGHDLRPSDTLAEAQDAVAATLLWHLRILAGWLPARGTEMVRLLAGWFEIANAENRAAAIAGAPTRPPFHLGSLRTLPGGIEHASTAADIRRMLANSAWGDPATGDPGVLRLALRARWAARTAAGIGPASEWAQTALLLLVAREIVAGRTVPLASVSAVPRAWRESGSLAELRLQTPPHLRWPLDAAETGEDVWRAEGRWWARLERDAGRMARRSQLDSETLVGVIGVLAADAHRLRAALAVASGRAAPEAAHASA